MYLHCPLLRSSILGSKLFKGGNKKKSLWNHRFKVARKKLFSFRGCELMAEVFYSILADKVNKVTGSAERERSRCRAPTRKSNPKCALSDSGGGRNKETFIYSQCINDLPLCVCICVCVRVCVCVRMSAHIGVLCKLMLANLREQLHERRRVYICVITYLMQHTSVKDSLYENRWRKARSDH